jgi:hypothetical protein
MKYSIVVIGILFATFTTAVAQTSSNLQCRWLKVDFSKDVVLEDSTSILPSTITLSGQDSLKLIYDPNTGNAKWKGASSSDSVLVCYRKSSFQFKKKYYNRSLASYDSLGYFKDDPYYNRQYQNRREELFSSPGIHKSGNISRGVSVGNNQNVFVNSVLNLQLEGKLTDDVSIIASISDQNVPFQPEGNTQQIQQFDKVFVQLKSKKLRLTAGDIVLQSNNKYFLKYYRNVQGGFLEYDQRNDTAKVKTYSSVGAAVSKGKFHSMQFGPGQPDSLIEGVQGPYRLRGPNNERFIMILANSEKIYVDGRLLTRGFDYDYVIDYNQAEITFTPRVIITKYTRMRVDFEFSDRNYSRTTTQASHLQSSKQGWYYFDYFSEKDNPNKPLTQSVSDSDKQYLATIGDTLSKAYVSGIDSVGYSANKVLYKKIQIGTATEYQYSTSKDSAFFEVRFTKVNMGQGRYLQSNSTVNGRVYKYVGYPNGDYEPIVFISTPKQKRLVVVGGGVNITSRDVITAEVGFSKNDQNLYSKVDNSTTDGWATKIGYENKGRPFIADYKWIFNTNAEYMQDRFSVVDRFRTPDFERNWNEDATVKANNILIDATTGIQKNELNKMVYKITKRDKQNSLNGYQQDITLNQQFGRYQIISSAFFSDNNQSKQKANWKRWNVDQYYTSKYIVPGIAYISEINEIKDSLARLNTSLMNFDEVKGYIRSNDTLAIKFNADYAYRTDYEVFQHEFGLNSIAQTASAGVGGTVKKNHELNALFTYRAMNNSVGPTPTANEENVTGRVDWNASLLNRHVRSEITVTTGTGRELKKQYVFQPVASGLGNYVWKDFNGDKIQELNEFVEKVYNDTVEYIKIFIPTDEYIKAYSNTYNQRLDISAPRHWKTSDKTWKRHVGRLSNLSTWTVSKKLTEENFAKRFLPFIQDIAEANLLSLQQVIRSTFFYNRSNPLYGVEAGILVNNSKVFLNQGFEKRYQREWNALGRLNMNSVFSIKLAGLQGLKSTFSDFLASKNFEIHNWKVAPELAYQPRNTIRLAILGSANFKQNLYNTGNNEKVNLYEVGAEMKLNKLSLRNITTTIKYIRIQALLNGTLESSPIGYEMLEALMPGNNYTWNVSWQQKLLNGLQFTLSYEGRKSETSKMIHIGRVQLSALF